MTYAQTCPRCGHVVSGDDRDAVADEAVEHAEVEHGHAVTREHILCHIEGADCDAPIGR